MEKEVVSKLINKGYSIAFAESCTAGLCAAKLVDVADASKVLKVSFVTYSNEAKMKYLDVKKEDIDAFDVVSEVVAKEMALGVAKEAGSNVGVGVTGVAGPTGGTDEIPVGTVCFGFYINGEIHTFTKQFGNLGRNNVREKSVQFIFEELLELL